MGRRNFSPRAQRPGSGSIGIGAKLFGTFFFSMFLALGLIFTGLILRDSYHTLETYTWPEVNAIVRRAEVVRAPRHSNDGRPYRTQLEFLYSLDGASRTSTLLGVKERSYSSYDAAMRALGRLSPGVNVTAYVDPGDPSRAILVREAPWALLFVLLPLVFVAVGAVGMFALWFRPDRRFPVSAGAGKRTPRPRRTILLGIATIFLVSSGWVAVDLGERVMLARQSTSWAPVEARVLASDVLRRKTKSDGKTKISYVVDILYQYEFGGRRYQSSRYDFFGTSSSSSARMRAIVNQFPVGRQFAVYVNPFDPAQAVIVRGVGLHWIWLLLPALFLVPALLLFTAAFRSRDPQRERAPIAGALRPSKAGWRSPSKSRSGALLPSGSRFGKFLGVSFFALCWNGAVGLFAYQAYSDFGAGTFEAVLMVFLVPFVLIGIVVAALVPHQFLAMFNPAVTLTIRNLPVRMGEENEIEWRIEGDRSRLDGLTVLLKGEEQKSARGENGTVRAKKAFFTRELVRRRGREISQSGTAVFTIPSDAATSIGPSADIVWALEVRGSIPRWPDISVRYPIEVV